MERLPWSAIYRCRSATLAYRDKCSRCQHQSLGRTGTTVAPRALHFGQPQLHWAFRELSPCELCPHGLPNAYHEWDVTRKDESFDLEPKPGVDKDPEAYWFRWNTILSLYAMCGMSRPSDKLLALGGVASRLHQLSGSEYLAGLWEHHLAHDLLWEVRYPGIRAESYRAPSWSWASIDCHLEPNEKWRSGNKGDAQSICTVVKASVTPSTSNRFGRISSAFLRINGFLRTILSSESSVDRPPNAYYLERLPTTAIFAPLTTSSLPTSHMPLSVPLF